MLLNYLTEIVSKKEWKEKYAKKVYEKIDLSYYKKALRFIKSKIFTPENLSDKRYIFLNPSGTSKVTKSNIVKYEIDENDKKIVELINKYTNYKIPVARMASLLTIKKVIHKDSKVLQPISAAFFDLLTGFNKDKEEADRHKQSRLKALEKAKAKYEETKDEALLKQINGIENSLKREEEKLNILTSSQLEEITNKYEKKVGALLKNKYVIVLTYDTRAVASQSTKVSWRSCMNLDSGEYKRYVPASITIGTFVAYLATFKDKNELKDPVARVLCKAYYGVDNEGNNPDVVWATSSVYPRSSREYDWFKQAVQEFLNQNNKPKYKNYTLTKFNYDDGDNSYYVADKYEQDNMAFRDLTGKYFSKMQKAAPQNYDDLDEDEQDEVKDIAYDMATEQYNIMDLDDSETRSAFIENYEDEVSEKAMSLAADELNPANYETDEEYQEALKEKRYEYTEEAEDKIIDKYNDEYINFLWELFNYDPSSYIDIMDYIDAAFDRYINDNY